MDRAILDRMCLGLDNMTPEEKKELIEAMFNYWSARVAEGEAIRGYVDAVLPAVEKEE